METLDVYQRYQLRLVVNLSCGALNRACRKLYKNKANSRQTAEKCSAIHQENRAVKMGLMDPGVKVGFPLLAESTEASLLLGTR